MLLCLQVRQLADYLLGTALTSKVPLLAYNHFIESIYLLNDCRMAGEASNEGRKGRKGRGEEATDLQDVHPGVQPLH